MLGFVTLALYTPVLTHQFLRYDDQQYVTENPHVQAGLSWSGVVWAFKSFYATNWHPLTWLSHMLDCQLFGLNPAGHHFVNALLHTANTVLLFVLLRRITGRWWPSAAVAALFGWHPLHVESVAWVAERKDVLSGLFFMLTLLAYAKYVERKKQEVEGRNPHATAEEKSEARSPKSDTSSESSKLKFQTSGKLQNSNIKSEPDAGSGRKLPNDKSWRWYALALALFALGLMSKPMLVTLPCVLLLLDYWPLGRMGRFQADKLSRVLLEKIPFFLLSAISSLLTLRAQEQAIVSRAGLSLADRASHAVISYGHYILSLVAPRHLAIYYPYQRVVPGVQVALAAALLVFLTILAVRFAKRLPCLPIGWFWFLGMLVPVIGLVQVGEQAWADRYSYLPSIGVFIIVAWLAADWVASAPARQRTLGWISAVLLAGLLAGTSVQVRYWKDTRTLFEHVDRVTRNNPLSATLLGSLLATQGRYDEAIPYYKRALSYSPGFPEAHFYLGHAYDHQGKLDQAIAEYEKALWFKPIQEQTHIRLGVALAKQGKLPEAAAHYEAALALNPESALAHNNLAKLLHTQGHLDEAIAHYSAALKYDPNFPQAHNNLGILYLQKGQTQAGIVQLREALRLKPGDVESQVNLAEALVDQHQWAEAADLFSKCVTADTPDPNVHYRFAVALAHVQKTREAMSHYASALLLKPDFPEALDGLSWILATDANPQFRNGAEAVRMAERACELTGRKVPAKLKTLAAAYAEAGRYAEAAATAQLACDLAKQAGENAVAEDARRMRERFLSNKPWHD
jgi:protein O-mannosyl-transferase